MRNVVLDMRSLFSKICKVQIYSRPIISKGLSEILRDIRTSTYQICRTEEKLIEQPHFINDYAIWLLKLEIYWKYCRKEEEQFLLFSTMFCYLFLNLRVRTGTRFSLRDKRLFEISEVEITRVDYSLNEMRMLHICHDLQVSIHHENIPPLIPLNCGLQEYTLFFLISA